MAGCRIDDLDTRALARPAAPDDSRRAVALPGAAGALGLGASLAEEIRAQTKRPRRFVRSGGRDEQRGLGQAVGRPERAAAGSRTARTSRAKASMRGCADRLRPVEGDPPGSRGRAPARSRSRHATHAQIVGEVRAAAVRGAQPEMRLQPSRGPLQERGRRHQPGRKPAERRLQHALDQPHVVVHRQPRHRHGRSASWPPSRALAARLWSRLACVTITPRGVGGRSGRVLKEGDVARVRRIVRRRAAVVCPAMSSTRSQRHAEQLGNLAPSRSALASHGCRGEHQVMPASATDAAQPSRRRGRGGRRTADRRAPQSSARERRRRTPADEVEPGRKEQQHARACGPRVRGSPTRSMRSADRAPRHVRCPASRLPIVQKGVGAVPGLMRGCSTASRSASDRGTAVMMLMTAPRALDIRTCRTWAMFRRRSSSAQPRVSIAGRKWTSTVPGRASKPSRGSTLRRNRGCRTGRSARAGWWRGETRLC